MAAKPIECYVSHTEPEAIIPNRIVRYDTLGRPVPEYLYEEWDRLAQVFRDAHAFITRWRVP